MFSEIKLKYIGMFVATIVLVIQKLMLSDQKFNFIETNQCEALQCANSSENRLINKLIKVGSNILTSFSDLHLNQNVDFIPQIGFCKSNFLTNLTTEHSRALIGLENCCIDFDICYQTCGADYRECRRVLKLCLRLKCENSPANCEAMKFENEIEALIDAETCDAYSSAQNRACVCEDRISY